MVTKARMFFLALLLAGVGVSAVNVAAGPLPVSAASAQSRDAGRNHNSGDHNGGKNDQRGDRQRGS